MNPFLMRQLWSLIEASHGHLLLSLDDSSLVGWLIDRLSGESPLNPGDTDSLDLYIRSRLSLIRDLASSR